MLIATIAVLGSVFVWAINALATGTESYHQSVNDPLPRYPRPDRPAK